MDLLRGHKPGSFQRRYDGVTPDQRRTYYAFRRHLGYSPAEVDAMPMLVRRMFVEEMNAEFAAQAGEAGDDGEPTTGTVTDDLGHFGLVAHEI